jgi:hypothetical protein
MAAALDLSKASTAAFDEGIVPNVLIRAVSILASPASKEAFSS